MMEEKFRKKIRGLYKAAMTSMDEAVNFLEDELNESTIRHSLREMVSGIEVALKAVLANKKPDSWREVFQEVEAAREKKFLAGDFMGVSFGDLECRLEALEVKLDRSVKETVRELRKHRNRLEHLGQVPSRELYSKVAYNGINAFIEIMRTNFPKGEQSELPKLVDRLKEIKVFIDSRRDTIRASLEKQESKVTCPECNELAAYVSEEQVHCAFCTSNRDGDEFALEYAVKVLGLWDRKSGLEWHAIVPCPYCEKESYLCTENEGWMCFSCNETGPAPRQCSVCQEYFVEGEEEECLEICGNCFDDKMNTE